MISQEIETHGVHAYSAQEMAFNNLGLMHQMLFNITQVEPVRGDLSSGLGRIADLTDMASRSRANMKPKTELRHATAARDNAKLKFINGAEAEHIDMDKSL
jgi:fatty acid synthase subunit alpha, fungi type